MELRHIRYFVAVAEELNMGRAAARLHIVQPALSKQIGALERELEVKLFDRSKGRLTLTPSGVSFLSDAKDMLRRIDRATQTTRSIERGEIGTLEVGFVGSAMWGILPWVLREHRRRVPLLRFRLHELTTAAQLSRLRADLLDVAFLRPPIFDEEIVFEPVLRETLLVALPDDHPLAGNEAVDLAVLAEETFVMTVPHESPVLYERCIALCRAYGFVPTDIEEADSLGGGLHFVGAGLGVLLVPGSMASRAWPGVVFRPLSHETAELDLAVAYRSGRERRTIASFLETIRDVVASPRVRDDPG